MKLADVTPNILSRLREDPFLTGLEIIANGESDHDRRLESALRETGLVLVVIQTSGTAPNAHSPRLLLENEVVVSILENPVRNDTGQSCLDVASRVLESLHQATWVTGRGPKNALAVDTPAYEAGPLDGGLVIYFCNFRIQSLQS